MQKKIGLVTLFVTLSLFLQEGLSQKCSTENKTSLFTQIYQLDHLPEVEINTDVGRLIRKKLKEEYQSAHFTLCKTNGEKVLTLPGRIRARGNIRKKVSFLPPVKIDFKKSVLDSLGYLKSDKLKMVLPENPSGLNQEKLLKEFFLYELYHLIDTNAINAKLVNVIFKKNKK